MATREEKREKRAQRMRTIRHQLFGVLGVDPEPGTVFNPLPWFLFGGFLDNLLEYFRRRAARNGIGSGLPREERRAALDDAAQAALSEFLDRDYEGAGITAPEIGKAVLTTVAIMKRRYWSPRLSESDGERAWFPLNRANDSRTPNPAAMVAAAEGTPGGLAMLTGEGCDEVRTGTVSVPGGRFRPRNHGRIQPSRIVRNWVERVPFVSVDTLRNGGGVATREAFDCVREELGWTMVRGWGKAQNFPASSVARTVDCREVRRWTPEPVHPFRPWVDDGGAVCNLTTRRRCSREVGYAADPEAYREALREYYGG